MEVIYRALGSNIFYPDAVFEACFATRSRIKTGEVRFAVGYFRTILRNMYRTSAIQAFINKPKEMDKPCKELAQIKEKLC